MLADEGAQVGRDLTKWPTYLGPVDKSLKPGEKPNQVSLGPDRRPTGLL
jgi:hypothetical protein